MRKVSGLSLRWRAVALRMPRRRARFPEQTFGRRPRALLFRSRPAGEKRMLGDEQGSLRVWVDQSEEAITERASVRYAAFLQRELEELPEWHFLAHEYRQQLRSLSARRPFGPQPLPSTVG